MSAGVIVAIVVLVVALAIIVVAIVLSRSSGDEGDASLNASSESAVSYTPAEPYPIETLESYSASYAYVQMDYRDFGTVVLELDPQAAPITVANFVELVDSGFYDGLTIHRISSNFVIQGGDPEGTGYGGSPNKIKGEFSANGYENPIDHVRGVISMARASNSMDSASSQFFICLNDATAKSLDGSYAAFGRVVVGMDVVDAIAAVPAVRETPTRTITMEKVTLLQAAEAE